MKKILKLRCPITGSLSLIDDIFRHQLYVWCKINCHDRFLVSYSGISFVNDDDFVLAALTFSELTY